MKTLQEFTFTKLDVSDYEEVLLITNEKVGLRAIIAIHDTSLGSALGGTRIYPYATQEAALFDVLRLSEGMTYKSALAESGFGGGKSVIIADPNKQKTQELLHAFGEAVDSLQGKYICAEDMGCSPEDVGTISEKTPYVVGTLHPKSSGNPSYYTAWGTYCGIKASLQHLYKNTSVKGKTVAIQGLGSVGMKLAEMLFQAGAKIIVTDTDPEKMKYARAHYSAKIVALNEIYSQPCDIFAPCAMGGILHCKTIKHLKCKVIAGCANNQLLRSEDADALHKKGILYAPDFVINAGGLINVAEELCKEGYNKKNAFEKTQKIYDRLLQIYEIADKSGISTHEAAISLARFRINYKIGKRKEPPVFHHALS